MTQLAGATSREAIRGDVACAHCALPVPVTLQASPGERSFCCHGCRAVWETIHLYGLERFYDLQDGESRSVPADVLAGEFEAFDHRAFDESHVTHSPDGSSSVELYLQGIHCAACVWLIEKLPEIAPGALSARVDVVRRTVRIVWDGRMSALSRIARLLDSLGYRPRPYRASAAHDLRREEDRGQLVRLAVAGAIAGNVMLISFALFGGMFAPMDETFRSLFRWTSLGLTLIALGWPGRVFLVGAVSSLRTGTVHMDVPVAIALIAGTAGGAVHTIRGGGQTYFESLTSVIFLLLVGRYVLHRRRRVAQEDIETLFHMTPGTARLIDGACVREVPVEAIECGARVEVRPGDSVPADGKIVEGQSSFDFSALTGESRPVERGPGERVWAGTTNLTHRAVVQVDATGAATRLGRLLSLVERLAQGRPPIVRLADRVAQRFVVAVLVLATATALFWSVRDPSVAMENAIALLIVTCPCALGLATPLALVAAIGHAARRGILIRGADALESLARPDLLLLDKTGTLTQGRIELRFWKGEDSVRSWIVAVERQVAHPIAHAFVAAFGEEPAPLGAWVVRQTPGGGVVGSWGDRELRIGSPAFVAAGVATSPEWALQAEDACVDSGLSPVWVAVEGRVVGVAGFGDPPHDDALAAVAALRRRGFELRVLSGDHPGLVRSVAAELGITAGHALGALAPEDKARIVQDESVRRRAVVMVGDGVNDAAALSAATVGVAVHGGAEASLVAADVFLARPGLGPLIELVDGARRTMAVIRRNIGVSLLYNLVAGSLAMAGAIDPLIASVLMPLSSLTVVSLSYRSRTFPE